MEDQAGELNREVRVPRALRVIIGVPLALVGLLFLTVLPNLVNPPANQKGNIVGTGVLVLTILLFSGSFTYVGLRLIKLKTHHEPLFSESAWRSLVIMLGLTGALSCTAAIAENSVRLLYAALGVLLLGASLLLHAIRRSPRS